MLRKLLGVTFVLMFVIGLIGPINVIHAAGSTYYVSTTGNDSNNGSIGSPWLTIQKAANTAVAGDTVYVRGGTYSGFTQFNNSGSAGNYITFAAYTGETPIIDVSGSGHVIKGVFTILTKSYIKIRGFTIRNYVPSGTTFDDFHSYGIYVANNSHHINIEQNTISNTASSGIMAEDNTSHTSYLLGDEDIVVDGNELFNVNTKLDNAYSPPQAYEEGLDIVATYNFVVRNNHIHDHRKEGMDLKKGSRFGRVYNNVIHDSTWEGAGLYFDTYAPIGGDVEIFNNTVYNESSAFGLSAETSETISNVKYYNNLAYNSYHGFVLTNWADNGPRNSIYFVNNTAYNNTYGINIESTNVSDILIRNNISSNNSISQITVTPASGVTIDHNLINGPSDTLGTSYVTGDPLFVNAASGDFHLQNTSPAINQGSSIGAPATDKDGNSRPVGAAYDIGAYENSCNCTSTNVASGKAVTYNIPLNNPARVTDGDKATANFADGGPGAQWVQIDLGASYNINKVNLWHYFGDGRQYHDVIVQVSNNAAFTSGVTTVFNNDTNNSAGQGTGTQAEYAETGAGKSITFSTVNARYVRTWTNGSTANTYNHWVEVEVWTEPPAVNAASGKAATYNILLNNPARVTDGDKATANFADGGPGAQWVQIDLGASYNINKINLWHYFGDGRQYHDVIVQLSNNAAFTSGVTTVFNNDTNNSAGQGTGTQAEYAETSAGKTITFPAVNARYVRTWTNGSTANVYNHWVEVEAWTN